MKPSSWLWGAIAGIYCLPLFMRLSLWIWTVVAPSLALPHSFAAVGAIVNHDGRLCGLFLGTFSAALWVGNRPFFVRLLSVGTGLVIFGYFARLFWRHYQGLGLSSPFFTKLLYIEVAAFLPLMLWALALIFFAVLIRPRSRSYAASFQTKTS